MSDDPKKKKKRNKNKNKKKGNKAGPASVTSLQYKVDVAGDPNKNGEENDLPGATEEAAVSSSELGKGAVGGVKEKNDTKEHDSGSGDDDNIKDRDLQETKAQEQSPEIHTHSVITTTTTTTYELDESTGDDTENVVVDVKKSSMQVDNAVAETITEFLSKDENIDDHEILEVVPGTPIHKLTSPERNIVVDVQSSPWKVDTDVQEIVQHNKRVRMTKITKSRKVIITKTEDGEEVETVVEEEDDDDPEVIGEIGAFGETENETVEIQRIVKKRRVILRKTADGDEIETVISDEGEDFDERHDMTTLVTTRKVIITQNEMGEDVETIVEDDQPSPVEFQEEPEINEDAEQPKNSAAAEVEHVSALSMPHREFVLDSEKGRTEDASSEKDFIHAPVEVDTVESEVDFHALLGPADEQHEKALMQQKQIHIHHSEGIEDFEEEDKPKEKPPFEGKEIIDEECFEIKKDGKAEEIEIEKIKPDKDEKTKIKSVPNIQSKTVLVVPSQRQPQMKQGDLTEEQKKILDEVKMPEVKNVLDDWVLVNFNAKEIAKFAELMRYKPGWMEDSLEMQRCCKMM